MGYKHGLKNRIKKCLICEKEFIAEKDCLTRNQLYCSCQCSWVGQKGKKPTEKQLEGLKKGRYKGKKIGGWKWSDKSKKKLSNSKKGIKLSENHKKALSEAKEGKPIKHFIENQKEISGKISKALMGKPQLLNRKENHWNWQGGITELNFKIRNLLEMKIWIREILKKDNFICRICKKRGGKLVVDHIKKFAQILYENKIKNIEDAKNCKELWDIENGRTLCKSCHLETETFGGGLFYNEKFTGKTAEKIS